jgi:hypothetical protein
MLETTGMPPGCTEASMNQPTFKCDRCGVVSDQADHLCRPHELMGKMDYCGQPVTETGSVCAPMSKTLSYECGTCGRPAEKPGMVCRPTEI